MRPEFLVIGAGVAGLRAAIELAEAGPVLVVAKDSLRESSSEYAQGGIAVALNDDDEVELHEQDTLYAGDGLCDRAAVRTLVEEGPAAIQELMEWGAAFDRSGGHLAFTREAAHSRSRVLHAHGDSTGREIARTLHQKACSLPNITFRSYAATTDLLLGGGVCGALLYDAAARTTTPIPARAVLLATGGLGRVFLNTTNPEVATGDGVAMAFRAGAEISDIEFVQFHPTALYVEGAPCFLLSEALRGEGGVLRNLGRAFYGTLSSAKGACAAGRGGALHCHRDGAHGRVARLARSDRAGCRISPRPLSPDSSDLSAIRRGHHPAARSGTAGGALRNGRRAHRSRWPLQPAGPVRGRRSGVHGGARRQPPGQQFAARRSGLRRARRTRHAGSGGSSPPVKSPKFRIRSAVHQGERGSPAGLGALRDCPLWGRAPASHRTPGAMRDSDRRAHSRARGVAQYPRCRASDCPGGLGPRREPRRALSDRFPGQARWI